ncbi:hypothetical protein OQA88_5830 [Cercophora sp. LCS_1]
MAGSSNPSNPRVAVIAIIDDGHGRVVAGRRIGPLGGGTWTFPGGHLDFGESIFGCAERETLEESGLVVRGVKVVGVTNDFFTENNLHYITVWARCERVDDKQQPQRMEPDKNEGWQWTMWQELEQMAADQEESKGLFVPLYNLVTEFPELGTEIKNQAR